MDAVCARPGAPAPHTASTRRAVSPSLASRKMAAKTAASVEAAAMAKPGARSSTPGEEATEAASAIQGHVVESRSRPRVLPRRRRDRVMRAQGASGAPPPPASGGPRTECERGGLCARNRQTLKRVACARLSHAKQLKSKPKENASGVPTSANYANARPHNIHNRFACGQEFQHHMDVPSFALTKRPLPSGLDLEHTT